MWKIKHIFDGEYGCEELAEGQRPKVSVTLINEKEEETANNSKARKLLSPDQEYPQKLVKLSRKMNSAVQENIMSLISTQNMHIDISL